MLYKKILIAIDDSPHSLNAAKKGFELAIGLIAQIGIAYIVDVRNQPIISEAGLVSDEQENILLLKANEVIDQLLKQYPTSGEVVRFTHEGFAKNEIVMIAKDWQADMIVMGTHGRSGLSYLLLGSVSEYVIKHAKVPVMVVPLK